MAKEYIPLSEDNIKVIKNFIGMCRMNGLEGSAAPSFNYKDIREGLGTVNLDLYYDFRGITTPCWKMTVKVDTDQRIHDDKPGSEGAQYSYVDTYVVDQGDLEIKYKNSRFNEFSF